MAMSSNVGEFRQTGRCKGELRKALGCGEFFAQGTFVSNLADEIGFAGVSKAFEERSSRSTRCRST